MRLRHILNAFQSQWANRASGTRPLHRPIVVLHCTYCQRQRRKIDDNDSNSDDVNDDDDDDNAKKI